MLALQIELPPIASSPQLVKVSTPAMSPLAPAALMLHKQKSGSHSHSNSHTPSSTPLAQGVPQVQSGSLLLAAELPVMVDDLFSSLAFGQYDHSDPVPVPPTPLHASAVVVDDEFSHFGADLMLLDEDQDDDAKLGVYAHQQRIREREREEADRMQSMRLRRARTCSICREHPRRAGHQSLYNNYCGCTHCDTCFEQYVRHGLTQDNARLRSQFAPLRCTCQTELQADDAEELCARFGLLDLYCDAMLPVYLLAQVTQPSMHARRRDGLFRCPHPGCSYGFLCDKLQTAADHDKKQPQPASASASHSDASDDDGVLPSSTNPFNCPLCRQPVCNICLHIAHPQLTCEQLHTQRAEELASVLSTVKGLTSCGLAQQCPFCGVVVERTDGCNYLPCNCGQGFCYRCGDKLDRNGKPFDPNVQSCECGSFQR